MLVHPRVLLLSCYELGSQPNALAWPLAFLKRAGYSATAIDLAVDSLDERAVARADFIGVSVPMQTALVIALSFVDRLRALNPTCHLCFYGLYAVLNAEHLKRSGIDSVLAGELEEELVERVRASDLRPTTDRAKVRLDFPVPERDTLPELSRYAHLQLEGDQRIPVGTVETTRGCLHFCRHCPIPPVYEGRLFVVPKDIVLADVEQLFERGARHLHFADADFLNGPRHGIAILREVHERHPELTCDFTAKVEHLLKHRRHLKELEELGCLFVVSAVESLSDRVLEELDKGHSRQDVFDVLALVRDAGIVLRPTFVPFTPWTQHEDYLDLLRWIAREDLVEHVDAVQLTLRLLIPPGSLLLSNPSLQPRLRGLDTRALTHRWIHPDKRMDQLQQRATSAIEAGVSAGRSQRELFLELAELAFQPGAVDSKMARSLSKTRVGGPPPRLTEPWFC